MCLGCVVDPATGSAGVVSDLLKDGFHRHLGLSQRFHKRLFRAHLIGQGLDLVREGMYARVCVGAAFLATGQGSLQVFEAFGGLFQKCLDIGGDTLLAITADGAAGQARDTGEPFFQVIVEPVLRLRGLQV